MNVLMSLFTNSITYIICEMVLNKFPNSGNLDILNGLIFLLGGFLCIIGYLAESLPSHPLDASLDN